MNEDVHKMIDQLMAEALHDTPLESPSPGFTSKVMSALPLVVSHQHLQYKPVISRVAWVIIIGITLAVIALVGDSGKWQPNAGHSLFGEGATSFFRLINHLDSIQFSSVTVTIVTVSTFLFLLQITLLKSHLNKRFQK